VNEFPQRLEVREELFIQVLIDELPVLSMGNIRLLVPKFLTVEANYSHKSVSLEKSY